MSNKEYLEKVLPFYLAGRVEEAILPYYQTNMVSKEELDLGFEKGLTEGTGLIKLLSNSEEFNATVDLTIKGARTYAEREAGNGRNWGIAVDFKTHRFLYGYFHGLELSTTIISGRNTEGDICRAFCAVVDKHKLELLNKKILI